MLYLANLLPLLLLFIIIYFTSDWYKLLGVGFAYYDLYNKMHVNKLHSFFICIVWIQCIIENRFLAHFKHLFYLYTITKYNIVFT